MRTHGYKALRQITDLVTVLLDHFEELGDSGDVACKVRDTFEGSQPVLQLIHAVCRLRRGLCKQSVDAFQTKSIKISDDAVVIIICLYFITTITVLTWAKMYNIFDKNVWFTR